MCIPKQGCATTPRSRTDGRKLTSTRGLAHRYFNLKELCLSRTRFLIIGVHNISAPLYRSPPHPLRYRLPEKNSSLRTPSGCWGRGT